MGFEIRKIDTHNWERVLTYQWKVAGGGTETTEHSIFHEFQFDGRWVTLGICRVYYGTVYNHPRNKVKTLKALFLRCVADGTVDDHFFGSASNNPYPRNDKWYEDDSLFPEVVDGNQ